MKEGKERVGVMSAVSGISRHLPNAHQGRAKLLAQRRLRGNGKYIQAEISGEDSINSK